MVKVTLTANLQRYFPQKELQLEARTVLEVLKKMDETRPQFSHYILEDGNRIRKHVNIFVNGELLAKEGVSKALANGSQVHIMQALSGG